MGLIPFQCLQSCGEILCAAIGGSIHSFTLDGSHVSSWKHPTGGATAQVEQSQLEESPREPAPPAKRRKVEADEEGEDETAKANEDAVPIPGTNGDSALRKSQKSRQNIAPVPEIPFVNLMVSTNDGAHLVAVTGQDKTVWVFKHDGNGHLEELSRRVMPKRPSSITLTRDENTIVSADKFGDVYSIPLVSSLSDEASTTGISLDRSTPSQKPMSASAQPIQRAIKANHLTVHSQRNLKALEHQLKQRKEKQETPKLDIPSFEHTLLLGHVSMLTAVTGASHDGKSYIITADRDEHIRVSRGIPQTHVIESYCLGHKSFITSLCIPTSRPELLISGGGDEELFVWDWFAGKLLSKVDLIRHVKEVFPDTSKVAVTKLYEVSYGNSSVVGVICERIPAVFFYNVVDNTLEFNSTIQLSGSPLDLTSAGDRFVIAQHQQGQNGNETLNGSLVVIGQHEGVLVEQGTMFATVPTVDIPYEQMERTLYTSEVLRKTEHDTQEV